MPVPEGELIEVAGADGEDILSCGPRVLNSVGGSPPGSTYPPETTLDLRLALLLAAPQTASE